MNKGERTAREAEERVDFLKNNMATQICDFDAW
jgi:hypothetical protein